MKPGPELDRLVAEKVMKLIIRDLNYLPLGRFIMNKDKTYTTFYPEYSTDIAAAWEVVECLSETGIFTLWIDYEEMWHCQFNTTSVEHNGNSAAHAICLAALKAVGVEI